MAFHRARRNLEIVHVRSIHVGATWPSTNERLKNFGEIYLSVLGSVLNMETVVGNLWTSRVW
jgi:hypothetical protein